MTKRKKNPNDLGDSTSEIVSPEKTGNTKPDDPPTIVTAKDLVEAIEWLLERRFCAQRLGNNLVRLLVADLMPVEGKPEQVNPVIHQSFSGNWAAALLACHTRCKVERAKFQASNPAWPNAN